ncbi:MULTISPECIES: bifunctional glycosyltransferase family 2/GtrA family protein [unclassified Paenibacillus]|uniref:bifunctional glycosyltransferase family 2/GtrA family protein n=1 Tax=unclassified Paenibacillus TaxID=185978 RepID=UPI002404D36D|nr:MULTISPECIES: bifunctional glycosyltransferase family 2/GtrA family protein [unclassified Paenibacillus]MDF9841784.1 putative flippase GtrA [Paenibacillus sp. PastF-2]MDF9848535.1 putative flippase GtrA [Paenibacillus sp. PastM-2]MDF9854944.1 putative flippase GtrA [Paenibacillus sp. PastF-1]MDH6480213.1 putative flippase GtrA [Paenibacillus sp. PastH-2]MDH6507803.1 putative flippase GtrA [Paenibacillus sp. PastM-3]
MTILIPAYEPDDRLLDLIIKLQDYGLGPILIVDDGSGHAYRGLFQTAEAFGCTVLTHPVNYGKGRALKTGFRYIQDNDLPGYVVCADSDGQHLPHDIKRVVELLHSQNKPGIVLGSRRFSGKVPLRSRFGNSVTRGVFALTTGSKVYDTQTGLRGFPPSMLDWLGGIPGDRFEYEMNMLLTARKEGYDITEEFIDTVYLDHNKSSHFRPLADSIRIYLPILMFSTSSLLSALIDFVLLFLFQRLTHNLFLSVVAARLCSSIFNYSVNRRFVFSGGKRSRLQSLPKYFSLVVLVLLFNYGLLYFYSEQLIIPLAVAKILTEVSIFVFSYWAQRRFVY